MFGQHLDFVGKELDLFDPHSDFVGQTLDLFDQNLDLVGQNVDYVCQNLDFVGQHVDLFGQNVDLFDHVLNMFEIFKINTRSLNQYKISQEDELAKPYKGLENQFYLPKPISYDISTDVKSAGCR